MSDNVLEKGDIVKDTSEESNYYSKQGKVVRVYANGTVMVRFPDFMVPDYLFYYGEEKSSRVVGYRGDEVSTLQQEEQFDQGELYQHVAKKQFGSHMWLRVLYPKEASKKNSECRVEGCCRPAYRERSLINYVGSVHVLDLCLVHRREWHGICTEGFPELKTLKPNNNEK